MTKKRNCALYKIVAPWCSDYYYYYIIQSCGECLPEAGSELYQTSKMELSEKIVNIFQQFTIFTKKLHLRSLTGL